MKSKLLLILLTIFIFPNIIEAQYNPQYGSESSYIFNQKKVIKFKKMETAGATMAVVGSAATILGVVLINNAEWKETTDYNGNTQMTSEDSNATMGLLSIIIGIPLGIAGSIVGIIGHNKKVQYQSKLDGLAFDIISTPKQNGLKLTYAF